MSNAPPKRGQPWLKFYPTDWRGDAGLRACSYAARGLWIDLIGLMHEATPYGYLAINGQAPSLSLLARVLGGDLRQITRLFAELEQHSVCSRAANGMIFSRRMVAERAKDDSNYANGKMGGNPEIRRGSTPKDARVRRYRASDSPEKTARILAKSGGCCHWCSKQLQRLTPGHDFYHVDHLVAVCDGGGNEESNLVAACAECNHGRARVGWSDPNPDCNAHIPDTRDQIEESKKEYPLPPPPQQAPDKPTRGAQTGSLLPTAEVVPMPSRIELPPWIPAEAWTEFVEARRQSRHPITPAAGKLLIRELVKLQACGNDPAEVINQSVMNGWRGLFPVKKGMLAREPVSRTDWFTPIREAAERAAADQADRDTGYEIEGVALP